MSAPDAPDDGSASADTSAAYASRSAPSVGDDSLPGPEAIEALLAPVRAFSLAPEQARLRGFLERLSASPPQVLLLEGGTVDERLAAAHYWTLLLNCDCRDSGSGKGGAQRPESASVAAEQPALPGLAQRTPPVQSGLPGGLAAAVASSAQPGLLPGLSLPSLPDNAASALSPDNVASAFLPDDAASAFQPGNGQALAGGAGGDGSCQALPLPCLCCPSCIRMTAHLHRDCFFLDGTAASIKIDDVRAVRAVLGEPPREARYRVVIFREAQALVEAAANALLKSFEDPRPATSFILLTPQRERLLPTLVSRSFSLTLPWPVGEDAAARAALAPLEAALCTFLQTGRELFERTGVKGAVDAAKAHALTGLCRRALAACIKARKGEAPPGEGLGRLLLSLPETRLRMLDEALAECQDSLIYGVNPALVVEWLATRMYFLLPRQ